MFLFAEIEKSCLELTSVELETTPTAYVWIKKQKIFNYIVLFLFNFLLVQK